MIPTIRVEIANFDINRKEEQRDHKKDFLNLSKYFFCRDKYQCWNLNFINTGKKQLLPIHAILFCNSGRTNAPKI